MRCAVADRIDVGQARLAERVDAYAVGAIGARRDQRLDRRNDADADDDEIGRNDLAVRQAHAGDMRVALDRIDADAEPEVDAVIAMLLFIEAGQIRARAARENAVAGFPSHDLLARLGAHRRRFATARSEEQPSQTPYPM